MGLFTGEWKVPTNDKEAEHMLSEGQDEFISCSLVGIYQCERATGATILGAFKAALQANVDADRRAQQVHSESANEPAEQVWWAGYEYVNVNQRPNRRED